jgi:Flp pilus assembly protein TadG
MTEQRATPTMTSAPNSPDLLLRLRDFARGKGGMAAVEFAVILPFMLTAYLGGIEIGDGVAIDRKVAITTRSVADLATRYTSIHDADMSTILGASSTIVAPYPPGPLAVTVSGVTVDNNGNATIDWSNTLNGTAHTKGSPVTLPGTLATTGKYYIWGEVAYAYTPTLGYVMTGTWHLSNHIFMSPRESATIVRIP